jgi:hypothetical protein
VIEAMARRDQTRLLVDGITAANDIGLTDAVAAPSQRVMRALSVLSSRSTKAGQLGTKLQASPGIERRQVPRFPPIATSALVLPSR